MTEKELCALPEGTPIRVKATALASKNLKRGGTLVFQKRKDCENDEYRCGMRYKGGVIFNINPKDYELIPQ